MTPLTDAQLELLLDVADGHERGHLRHTDYDDPVLPAGLVTVDLCECDNGGTSYGLTDAGRAAVAAASEAA